MVILQSNPRAAAVWAAVLFFVNCAAGVEPRFIRLRNELIDTGPPARSTTAPSSTAQPAIATIQPPSQIASGLFLIQFRDHS